jgi:hypothetical protein
MKLHQIAHCRAGDKGDTSTLALFAYDPAHYPLLVREFTADRVREHLKDIVAGEVLRWELPKVHGLQFVCAHALLSGVTTSLALDPHGKALSYALLNLEIDA